MLLMDLSRLVMPSIRRMPTKAITVVRMGMARGVFLILVWDPSMEGVSCSSVLRGSLIWYTPLVLYVSKIGMGTPLCRRGPTPGFRVVAHIAPNGQEVVQGGSSATALTRHNVQSATLLTSW